MISCINIVSEYFLEDLIEKLRNGLKLWLYTTILLIIKNARYNRNILKMKIG